MVAGKNVSFGGGDTGGPSSYRRLSNERMKSLSLAAKRVKGSSGGDTPRLAPADEKALMIAMADAAKNPHRLEMSLPGAAVKPAGDPDPLSAAMKGALEQPSEGFGQQGPDGPGRISLKR